eukprot:scaffold206637_cov35-Tisochrysis_lutea.AAC.1
MDEAHAPGACPSLHLRFVSSPGWRARRRAWARHALGARTLSSTRWRPWASCVDDEGLRAEVDEREGDEEAGETTTEEPKRRTSETPPLALDAFPPLSSSPPLSLLVRLPPPPPPPSSFPTDNYPPLAHFWILDSRLGSPV